MKPPRSSLSQAIRAASEAKAEQADQLAGKPENGKTSKPFSQKNDEALMVNLSIKVSKRQRLHWLIEAKKQGTNLTEAIVTALTARFGATSGE